MGSLNDVMATMNNILWHNVVLFVLLGTGIVLTIWSRFSQGVALTHGWKVIRGHYDDPDDRQF